MYLVTSPLDQYWSKNQKILLLGEWCISDNFDIETLDYELLPYHWNGISEMTEDMNYIYSKYVELIPQIANHMNIIFSKEYSNKYWHFLIGPWLFKFLHILFDRYKSLLNASKLGYNLETVVVPNTHIPETLAVFFYITQFDSYNYCLYSDILKNSEIPISFKEADSDLHDDSISRIRKKPPPLKKLNPLYIRKLLSGIISPNNRDSVIRRILDYKKTDNDVQIVTTGMHSTDEKDFFLTLNHKLNKRFNIRSLFPEINKTTNYDLRSKPINSENDDSFTQISKKLIPKHIPMEYLEYFNEWNSLCNSDSCGFAEKPKKIIIRCPMEAQSLIRYYCAEKWEKGSKIISMQHGGGYGVRPFKCHDEVEHGLCDFYLTWGWESNSKNVSPFFFTKTHWIKNYNYKKNGSILLLGCWLRKYYEDILALPPSFNNIHLDYNSRLIKNLNEEQKKKIIYRFHNDAGFNEQKKIKSLYPDLVFSTREVEPEFYRLLYGSSIMIATTNATTFLQSFFIDHPTLILWPKDFNIMAKSTAKYYKLLEDVEILFHNPEHCAEKLNLIKNNPMDWWQEKEIQKAKNIFLEKVCRKSNNFGIDLANAVKKLN